ncbi:RNA methyltransferase [Thermosyntropha sp.]|uniref:TrmH family RNA methyltransferase n=1 Tax=Thermosyntropha sp. TaxID=2740820 RepID=UPI0025F8C4F6|nr:RNA methyltransferase [Thermosyntropha sp.]MBO8158609.1 RNA methyltransferase [Thermosyntropha sp.]
MKKITSKENPQVKLASSLKHRKFRLKEGLFILEGKKMVREALESSENALKSIFVSENVREEYESLAEQYNSVSWYVVDDRLMKHICGTETPQGVAGIARIPSWDFHKLLKSESLIVLGDKIADPGNLGTIIRTAFAFNVGGILLTSGSADPFSPKVVRSSMGGILNVPIFTDTDLGEIKAFKENGYVLAGASINSSLSYENVDYTGKKIIVIGSEAHGISPEIRGLCDVLFTIPINPRVDSLNAAIACAIILSRASLAREGL